MNFTYTHTELKGARMTREKLTIQEEEDEEEGKQTHTPTQSIVMSSSLFEGPLSRRTGYILHPFKVAMIFLEAEKWEKRNKKNKNAMKRCKFQKNISGKCTNVAGGDQIPSSNLNKPSF